MTMQADLEQARRYERQGRSDEAAAVYSGLARALQEGGDWPTAIVVRARLARVLADSGNSAQALRNLATADQALARLPADAAAGPRAAVDAQAAHVLAAAGRTAEAARRAWAATTGHLALGDRARADRAAVHAAKLIVKDAGPRGALEPLRALLALLPPGDGHHRVAALLAGAERRPDRIYDVLVTDIDAPVWGRLAGALAVGAHLAVGNGVAWNTMLGDRSPEADRHLLERDWGITGAAGWREQADELLKAENSDPRVHAVLLQRRRGMRERDWREAIVAWAREYDFEDAVIGDLFAIADVVQRYEARFRADGLLAPDGRVDSVHGYDYGRAVNLARWGLNARFCDAEAAEEVVLRAAHLAGQAYDSWTSFSTGYILGRMLKFDRGEFGEMYEESLLGHRILIEDPESPWRLLAWG
ncbi:DUF1266 domain-containing protein [Actinomadura macrotermitis]|uniref:DUF1266 domain-containing protein n=1 Tax=Actinomadura macrotermitis TaxID=2585200 RepID=A0A7K0C6N2_9ACTN|nr:DUF1266 domain-containing protein [Actinomadura macrotermitis]MQY09117.1 hypothetical protein [Actinomadura macrotermitis]